MDLAMIKGKRGGTTLEFSLMMPIVTLVVFAVVEFGWLFVHQHALQFATREGMRVGLLGVTLEDENNDPLSREESIFKAIQDNTFDLMTIDPSQIWIFPIGADYTDPDDWDEAGPNAGASGTYMRVRVHYTHEFFTPLIGEFFSQDNSGIILAAEGTYRNEDFNE